MGLGCLLLGNFIFVYTNVFTAAHWGYDDLVKWALLSPFYWVLSSIASYMALWELLTRPHHWQKTNHGLVATAAATQNVAIGVPPATAPSATKLTPRGP